VQGGPEAPSERKSTGYYGYAYYYLLGPDGQQVTSGSYQTNETLSHRLVLPRDGQYVLYVSSPGADSSTMTSQFSLTTYSEPVTDLALGSQVSGSIAAPGDINHYRFTLSEPTTIMVDNRNGNAALTLTGPRGTEYSTTLATNDTTTPSCACRLATTRST
jgi:hypothetical protein